MTENHRAILLVVAFFIVGSFICAVHKRQLHAQIQTMKRRTQHTMVVTSSAFKDGERMPDRYTCIGENVSPDIAWSNVPDKAKTIAMVCDDPDAPTGTWVHWVIFNIPAGVQRIPEAVPHQEKLSDGSIQGINSFGKTGFGGACPPKGHGRHHYFFKVYALDRDLDLDVAATKQDLETAMIGHVLATGELMGIFSRD